MRYAAGCRHVSRVSEVKGEFAAESAEKFDDEY